MSKVILIDMGSSTLKANQLTDGVVKLMAQKSYPFKKEFDPEVGLSEQAKKEVYEFIEEVKRSNPESKVKIYATALYRKMSMVAKIRMVDEFYEKAGLFFNVIEHDLENFYLEMALVGKLKLNEPVLLINAGGGSTELVVMYGREAVERHNIEVGVGTINSQFPMINNPVSGVRLGEVLDFVREKLPLVSNKCRVAFYTGGELGYMQVAKYPLKKNTIFKDLDHPSVIETEGFAQKNVEIFSEIKLADLENLMPDNPGWMHGARGCSALAQAICEKYGIELIVPSNSNLIDGVVRQEFRCVTISGSFRKHLDYILKVKKSLESQGVGVLSPRFEKPKNPGEEFVVFSGEEGQSPLGLERHHLNSIQRSDALIVCDPEGYVGASAMIEIGFAKALGKRVIFTEKPAEFMLNTLPCEVGM